MDRKKPLNLTVPADLAERFEELCKAYGHGKQKGVVLSAAILMYLAADPQKQGEMLQKVIRNNIADGVERMTERARGGDDAKTTRPAQSASDATRQPKGRN